MVLYAATPAMAKGLSAETMRDSWNEKLEYPSLSRSTKG
jgi:hypothetical protein